MARRRRPLTRQQIAEIQEAALRGLDGKPLRVTMRSVIEETTSLLPRDQGEPANVMSAGGGQSKAHMLAAAGCGLGCR